MKVVKQIESTLAGIFKDLPALPKGGKEGLVTALPYVALIFGVLYLFAAWSLYGLTNVMERSFGYLVGYGVAPSPTDKLLIYLGVAILVIQAIILLMAYVPLTKKIRRGWELIFLVSLINIIYAAVALFISTEGFGSFIGGVVGSAIGFYLLFQIRDSYSTGKKDHSAKHATTATSKKES